VLDRPGVRVVVRISAQVGDRAREPVPGLERMAEAAARQDVDLDEREVLGAAGAQRRPHALVGEHAARGGVVVLGRDRRARARDRAARAHGVAAGEVDHDLGDATAGGEHDERLARGDRTGAVAPGQVSGLLRLAAGGADDPRAGDGGERGARRAAQLAGVEVGQRVCHGGETYSRRARPRPRSDAGLRSSRNRTRWFSGMPRARPSANVAPWAPRTPHAS
jgi:hypothetical protein